MRCPKCNYNNLDGSSVCNLCGELLHGGAKTYLKPQGRKRPAPSRKPAAPEPFEPWQGAAPPSVGGGMAAVEPLEPALREIRHCLVCFPLDPVKLQKDRPYDIGRSKKCTIILPVGMVSRKHARIAWKGKAFVLTDLESHNGTRVNGELVREHPLRNRDQIRIGPYNLDYFAYAGDTSVVSSQQQDELQHTQDITIGDPSHSVNTFRGNIAEMHLGDIMQLLNLTRKSGALTVKTRGNKGTIHFRSGDIVDAVYLTLQGESAFRELIKVQEGTFKFTLDESDRKKTILTKTQDLLLAAIRQAKQGS